MLLEIVRFQCSQLRILVGVFLSRAQICANSGTYPHILAGITSIDTISAESARRSNDEKNPLERILELSQETCLTILSING